MYLFIVSLVKPFVAELLPYPNSFRAMDDQHTRPMSRVYRLETSKRYIALFIRTPRGVGCPAYIMCDLYIPLTCV